MKRAGVFIGVDKTGGLPKLADAARSAKRLADEWAKTQPLSPVELITDEGGEVKLDTIREAVTRIVDAGNVEQLVVYFAGHGWNLAYNEYWLLSGAPRISTEAVNVKGSALLAQYCGIPHVVFVSDACRTAPDNAQAQRVTGGEIFPNDATSGSENPVDLFYACTLGRPALEAKDPQAAADEHRGLYTAELLDALAGKAPGLLEKVDEPAGPVCYIRPRPLKKHLSAAVTDRIRTLQLQTRYSQVPDAHIASDQTAWISRVPLPAPAPVPPAPVDPTGRAPAMDLPAPNDGPGLGAGGMGSVFDLRRTVPVDVVGEIMRKTIPPVTTGSISSSLVRAALTDPGRFEASLDGAARDAPAQAASLVATAKSASRAFGPMHHETHCGFKVQGALVARAVTGRAAFQLYWERTGLSMNNVLRPGCSVLLVFDSGNGVVLPAIPDFLASLTVDDGELVNVSYEPSDNTLRWGEYAPRATEVRNLRGIAASATRDGVFRLEDDDALEMARRMQMAKGVDPTLGLYAAYAYHDMNQLDRLREMSGYMRDDLGARLFDVALLARELRGVTTGKDPAVLSFMPLLSQGWALLPAQRIELPQSLQGLHEHLVPSVWTMFDAEGVQRLEPAIATREVL